MKRKIALLQVLTPRVPLIILDEPTNTLDPTMRDELVSQWQAATEHGQAVLFSSHVLSEVEQICDRVAILQRGRLVHLQPMDELRKARLVQIRLERLLEPLPELPGVTAYNQQGEVIRLEQRGDGSCWRGWHGNRSPMCGLIPWASPTSITAITGMSHE